MIKIPKKKGKQQDQKFKKNKENKKLIKREQDHRKMMIW